MEILKFTQKDGNFVLDENGKNYCVFTTQELSSMETLLDNFMSFRFDSEVFVRLKNGEIKKLDEGYIHQIQDFLEKFVDHDKIITYMSVRRNSSYKSKKIYNEICAYEETTKNGFERTIISLKDEKVITKDNEVGDLVGAVADDTYVVYFFERDMNSFDTMDYDESVRRYALIKNGIVIKQSEVSNITKIWVEPTGVKWGEEFYTLEDLDKIYNKVIKEQKKEKKNKIENDNENNKLAKFNLIDLIDEVFYDAIKSQEIYDVRPSPFADFIQVKVSADADWQYMDCIGRITETMDKKSSEYIYDVLKGGKIRFKEIPAEYFEDKRFHKAMLTEVKKRYKRDHKKIETNKNLSEIEKQIELQKLESKLAKTKNIFMVKSKQDKLQQANQELENAVKKLAELGLTDIEIGVMFDNIVQLVNSNAVNAKLTKK